MTFPEDPPAGAPGWMVTYSDMMSLLLCFFVLLFAMGKTEEHKFQSMSDAFQQQFGGSRGERGLLHGQQPTFNLIPPKPGSELAIVAGKGAATGGKISGRADGRFVTHVARSGELATRGTIIAFPDSSYELTEKHRQELGLVCRTQLSGKPNRIEIRGHAGGNPPAPEEHFADEWDLAFQRCRQVMSFLAEQPGIDVRRIRLGVCGRHEPRRGPGEDDVLTENSHVEVFLLSEMAEQQVDGQAGDEPLAASEPETETAGGADAESSQIQE